MIPVTPSKVFWLMYTDDFTEEAIGEKVKLAVEDYESNDPLILSGWVYAIEDGTTWYTTIEPSKVRHSYPLDMARH